jgi:hypothetical protein
VVLSPQTDLSWWTGVEARWFAPVRRALAAGQVEALVIEELTGARYIVTRRELRRWWRRRRPVSACS